MLGLVQYWFVANVAPVDKWTLCSVIICDYSTKSLWLRMRWLEQRLIVTRVSPVDKFPLVAVVTCDYPTKFGGLRMGHHCWSGFKESYRGWGNKYCLSTFVTPSN